jgi:putative nucleotide binding protein
MEKKTSHEETAIVLDFLPNGYPFDTRPIHVKTPIAQAVGKEHFVLLELVPKKEVTLQPHDEVYIGEGKRDKIHHINGRLPPSKLTSTAKAELEFVIMNIVKNNEKRFVDFFNKAQPLSTRMHSIELIPGMGKKRMWEILDERKAKPFESFEDLKTRVKLIPDPEKAVVRRILEEIQEEQKHYLFVKQ